MAQLTNYKYSDVQTDIERFEGDEFCVIIKWDGEAKTIETYQRGYKDSLYSGEGMEAARESTGLSQEDWDSLLSIDVEYMTEASRDAWYSDAYNTGFEACKQGEPREDNPYHIDALSRDAWYSGWDDAN